MYSPVRGCLSFRSSFPGKSGNAYGMGDIPPSIRRPNRLKHNAPAARRQNMIARRRKPRVCKPQFSSFLKSALADDTELIM